MLVFFDIDATMITTGGVGVKAMVDAGREFFGPGFHAEGIDFAGRLDPLILADMLTVSGIPVTGAALASLRTEYRRHLERRLAPPGVGRALPGVRELLDAVAAAPAVALGVLTGNFAETGSMKLRACGIEPDRFHVQVWGDDSPHTPPSRDHLPGVGLDRYRVRFGRAIDPGLVTVIGDTPNDVSCARAHGCRSLAVATGRFRVAALEAAGADRVVADLSRTDDVLGWLLAPGAPC